jgi:uncharacterized protein with HEPN domain
MLPHDLLYFRHMLDAARRVVEKTANIDRQAFDGDENLRLAVTPLIQIFGEAARRVSHEGHAAYPAIPWQSIVGMRRRIVHDYMVVDETVVWNVAVKVLPDLVALVSGIAPS